MVLGLRSKHRKGNSVQVDYIVHVKEIKPWPPSQSLRSVQSVLLQWENGDRNSALLASGVADGSIEFKESFMLHVTLCREKRAPDNFQKNCLEFNLYEPRKDKAAKGQLLGTAILNLADYGIIKEILTVSVPVNCKKSSKNTAQPVLFINIQPYDKDSSNSSPKGSLSKDTSLDRDGGESVSELMNEEDDESEIASFTDDDVSSHSSRTISSSAFETTKVSPPQNEERGSESAKDRTESDSGEPALPLGVEPTKPVVNSVAESFKLPNETSHTPATVSSSDLGHSVNNHANLSKFPERNFIPIQKNSFTSAVQSSSTSLGYQDKNEKSNNCIRSFEQEDMTQVLHEEVSDGKGKIQETAQQSMNYVDKLAAEVGSSDTYIQVGANSDLTSSGDCQADAEDYGQAPRWSKNGLLDATTINDVHVGSVERKEKKEQREDGQDKQILEEKRHSSENKQVDKFSQDDISKRRTLRSDTLTFTRRGLGVQGNNKLKHVKSVQLPFGSAKPIGFSGNSQNVRKAKEIDTMEDDHSNATGNATAARNGFGDDRIEWKSKIELLEEELRETAALEAALYSIVAEHGSSANKVHAPARRLSRFYLHACKARSQAKRASAARAAVSGLVLVSKACGNDVPRLTFWLSNSIMLRVIVNQAVGEILLSDGPHIDSNGGGTGSAGRFPLKRDESSFIGEEKNHSIEECDDWEDPQTFTIALEKLEAWIFYRIVESVWWQTLTPHMQSTAAKISGRAMGSNSRKTNGTRYVLGDQEQGNFSIGLWKKAFKDACERLCPIRAGGHECGCLPVLARLVMEQLVARLDVAMFNAILRESAEEMPTDPVSDPISDSKVLPIPAGKSSFGAGAQLKNAIGNWSRWLTDLFGIEDSDSPEDTNTLDEDNILECESETSFKAFRLLNALSDLMMLPFEMLADGSTRKEVCPTFGTPLIKRVLNNFIPDEFCPEPIPVAVLEALDAEDNLEASGESVTSFPCIASPTVYSPPPGASLTRIIGEVGSHTLQRSGSSSVVRKSHASDDELDELDSPITSIVVDNSRVYPTSTNLNWMPKGKGGRNVVRYQLLREVWKESE
uniref:C2 NT-type domain-containing protein n=1 Tax=Davidia involucrata TaxID=16924 RepID=A0A5B6YXZ7_DAVIN